ncbi:PrgI family protein [Enterococcus olivae]
MAIEVSVRKEIKTYKEKLIFGFSIRQALALSGTVLFTVGIGVLNYFFWRLPIDDIGLVLMFLSVPILSLGWYKKEGMPVEQYVKILWRYLHLAPNYPFVLQGKEFDTIKLDDKKERKKRTECGN